MLLLQNVARFGEPLFNLKFRGQDRDQQQYKQLKRYVYANYATLSRGVLWNIPQVPSIFSEYL